MSGELAEWLQDKGMRHTHGASFHIQTQGQIERWQQTLMNRILLKNYSLSCDLEAQIEMFINHYNDQRYHKKPEQSYTSRCLLRFAQSPISI